MTRDQVVVLKKGDHIHYDGNGEHVPGLVQSVGAAPWNRVVSVYVHVPLQRRAVTVTDIENLHLPADCPQARHSASDLAIQPTLL